MPQPPTMDPIPPKTAHPNQLLAFPVTATDPDGDPITFSLINNPPAGAAMDGQGNFTWTPTWAQLGAYTLTARVVDSTGLADTKSFTVTVGNQPPVINPIPPQPPAHPGRLVSFPVMAFDPDMDPVTFSLVSAPAGAAIDDQGNFTWTPTWAQLGAYTITVRVTDPGGLFDTRSVTITVANQPPTIGPISAQPPAHPGRLVSFSVMAFDPDMDPVTFSLTSAPAGAAIDDQGNFTWTPSWGQLGAHTITIRATDPGAASSTRSTTITVNNQPPAIGPIPPPPAAHPDRMLMFSVMAADPDLDPLTYALVNPPAGAVIDGMGNVTWTPTWAQLGAKTITVRVTDPAGLSDTRSVTVNVANQAPVMSPLQDLNATVGMPVSFTATATDPDLDPLTFSLVNPPNGASIDAMGNFMWIPDTAGAYTITVRVIDPGSLSDTRSCTITVT
ncbi:MAG: putative Ig domain-containing protein [Gemmataceae bacterium]|nr:putative Ig domain-containing protein [Gemmataceae bacterium]